MSLQFFIFLRLEIERSFTRVQRERKIFIKLRSKINFYLKLSNEILKSQTRTFSQRLRVAEIKRSLH